jgi:hypothetical protein
MERYDTDVAAACSWTLMDAEGNPALWARPGGMTSARLREHERPTEAEAWADCPAFSGSADAALLVLERLTVLAPRVRVEVVYEPERAEPWMCVLVRRAGDAPRLCIKHGATLPEAACRAAVALVERLAASGVDFQATRMEARS